MKRILFLTIATLCVLAVAFIQKTQAQGFDVNAIKNIPSFTDELPLEEFEKGSDLVTNVVEGDSYLDFEVRLPKGWIKLNDEIKIEKEKPKLYNLFNDGETFDESPGADKKEEEKEADNDLLSHRLLGKIARFIKPTNFEIPSRLEVRALNLDYEITVRNWFLDYVLANSYILQGMKVHSPSKVEALYVVVTEQTPYVVRTMAILNGKRIVLVSHYVPEDQWKEERGEQERIIESFRFLSPQTVQLQSTRTYVFLDLLKFNYPVGWSLLVPNIFSVETMDAKLLKTKDRNKISGEIEIHVISVDLDTSVEDEIKYYTNEVVKRGLNIGKLIETNNYELSKHLFYSRFDVYKASGEGTDMIDYEYWLGVMVEDRFFYIVTMITPAREEEFYTWARNIEAYQTVVESIRP